MSRNSSSYSDQNETLDFKHGLPYEMLNLG